MRGGGGPAQARVAGAAMARELACDLAAAPQAGAARAAPLPRAPCRGRDGARAVRRAAARARALEALRSAAVRVPRIVPATVRLQQPRAGYDRDRGSAGGPPPCPTPRRRMGRGGAPTTLGAGSGERGTLG